MQLLTLLPSTPVLCLTTRLHPTKMRSTMQDQSTFLAMPRYKAFSAPSQPNRFIFSPRQPWSLMSPSASLCPVYATVLILFFLCPSSHSVVHNMGTKMIDICRPCLEAA
ncbi:hypothetical protein LZ32DRAFT_598687 [Colletotrichum eremochloae]|nr:hypothetical protein LZ32DRAFT_598687 [Colletotrichum eremochloae]